MPVRKPALGGSALALHFASPPYITTVEIATDTPPHTTTSHHHLTSLPHTTTSHHHLTPPPHITTSHHHHIIVTKPSQGEGMLRDGSVNMTRSFCGTEQYMSPEMLLQQVTICLRYVCFLFTTRNDMSTACILRPSRNPLPSHAVLLRSHTTHHYHHYHQITHHHTHRATRSAWTGGVWAF
jgi:serine/threonine protein kinase